MHRGLQPALARSGQPLLLTGQPPTQILIPQSPRAQAFTHPKLESVAVVEAYGIASSLCIGEFPTEDLQMSMSTSDGHHEKG